MKNVMRVLSPSLCILLLLLLSTCFREEVEIKEELPDFTVVDISEESSWDYWVVGKEEYFYIDEESSLPTSVFYHSFKNGKEYGILFNNQGLPKRVITDGYIFLFHNYNGNKVDIGLITPSGEIFIAREIENSFDWLTPPKSIQAKSDVIRWTGRVIGAIPCVTYGAAAFMSVGAAAPIALWTCGHYFAKMANNFFDDAGVVNGYTEFYTAYDLSLTSYKCTMDVIDCLSSLASKALEGYADYIEEMEEKEELLLAAEAALSTPLLNDNFESYTVGSFPSSWVADGNATEISQNNIVNNISYSSTKSLKLFGSLGDCWAALAYHSLNTSAPFEVELAVRNGNEVLSGCNPDRATIGLRNGTSWMNPQRVFVKFDGNGRIYGGGGLDLGSYNTNTWYLLKIKYERISSSQIRLSYWINNNYVAYESLSAINEESQLNNLEICVLEGSAWFDDIKIIK